MAEFAQSTRFLEKTSYLRPSTTITNPRLPNDWKITQGLLAILHTGGAYSYWWTLPGKIAIWWSVGDPARVPDSPNVYFGVHPTAKNGGEYERSRTATIAAVNCIFAEFDEDKGATRELIENLEPVPSVVIASGGGWHSYWLLTEPFIIRNNQDRERIRKIQADWVDFIGGDPGAKDLARVLRLPGTFNSKYDPPRPVEYVWADLNLRHELDALAVLTQTANPAAETPQRALSVPQDNRTAGSPKELGDYLLHQGLVRAPGNRNRTGFWLTCQLRDNKFTQAEAEVIVLDYAREVAALGDHAYTESEARASLREAYASQPREPWHIRQPNGNGYHACEAAQVRTDTSAKKNTKKPVPTDDELRDRWLAKNPLTAYGMGEWRRYDSGLWSVVSEGIIRREIMDVLEAAKFEGVRPTHRLLNSVMELARWKVEKGPKLWDSDPDILVCKNGALHIPSKMLLPHEPGYYVTSGLAFNYDPTFKSPLWERVIKDCLGDAEEFVQEFAGLSLTIDTKFEIALWLTGYPGSGKSTVLTGFQAMLGARAGLLGLGDVERSRFALTNLPGKTLMVSTEQPEDFISTAYILNRIISGEPIEIDRKFRDPVTIIPRAKLAWAMNELPRVATGGVGLFRRVKVVELPVIPENKRDPTIKESIKELGAAVLNWALDGLERLRQRGHFELPDSVQEATANFKASNDIPAIFVNEKCITGLNFRTQGSLLYNAYHAWCIETGHKPLSSTTVAEDWKRLGFKKYKSDGRSFWRGLGLST
jgi:P4 family phage/plasmid primase-like protien